MRTLLASIAIVIMRAQNLPPDYPGLILAVAVLLDFYSLEAK